MSLVRTCLLLSLPILSALTACASSSAVRPEAQAAVAEEAVASAESDRPIYDEEGVATLQATIDQNPQVAAQFASPEEREVFVQCVVNAVTEAVPTHAKAEEMGMQAFYELNEEIGKRCMIAHITHTLTRVDWTESFAPVYANQCTAQVPDAPELCACFGAKAREHFESPAALNAFEQVYDTDPGPTEDQIHRFEALQAACAHTMAVEAP